MPTDWTYTTCIGKFWETVVDVNGDKVDEVGFVWSETSHSQPSDGTTPSDTNYEYSINKSQTDAWDSGDEWYDEEWDQYGDDNLKYNTTYYARAYAKNSEGYSYSSGEISFQTPIIKYENTTINISSSVLDADTSKGWALNPVQISVSGDVFSVSETTKATPFKRVRVKASGSVNISETVRTNESTIINISPNIPSVSTGTNLLEPDPIVVSSDSSIMEKGKASASFETIDVFESVSMVETGKTTTKVIPIEVNSSLNTISEDGRAEENTSIDINSDVSVIEKGKGSESVKIIITQDLTFIEQATTYENSSITVLSNVNPLSETGKGEEQTEINIQGSTSIKDTGRAVENTLIEILSNMFIDEKGKAVENTLIEILANVQTLNDVPTVEDVLRLIAEVTNVVQFDRKTTTPIKFERDID